MHDPNAANMKKQTTVSILALASLLLVLVNAGRTQNETKEGSRKQEGVTKGKYVGFVELMNGKRVSGKLVSAEGDSLVMLDKNKMAVGSHVSVQRKSPNGVIKGTVYAMTDSTLILSGAGSADSQTAYVIWLQQIDQVKVNSYPPSLDVNRFQRTAIEFTEIESVRIHRKGSGGLGALLGAVTVPLILIAGSGGPGGSTEGGGGATFVIGVTGGAILGAAIGAAIGSSNKKHTIHGNQEKFAFLAKKITR